MGRLISRIREGTIRLAWVIAVPAALYRAGTALLYSSSSGLAFAHSLERFEVFAGIVYLVALAWVWEGFRFGKLSRARARVLRTRRLVMRRILPADLARLHQILSDPETMRYWDTPAHADYEATAAWAQRIIVPEDPMLCDDFVVVRRGRVIGVLGSLRFPWVSFVFDKREWRKGYAGEALAAFASYMFERGCPYLRAATSVDNMAARALLSGAGFHESGKSNGVWRVQGELAEAMHYRINANSTKPDAAEERATIVEIEAACAAAALAHPEGVGQP